MTSILCDTLLEVLNCIEALGVLESAYAVIGGAFKYAKSKNFVPMNFTLSAIKTKRAMEKKRKRSEGKCQRKTRPKLTLKQLLDLLWLCKEKYPDLFLPLLITATTGFRISELIAIKFISVNINQCEITIKNQSGRKLDDTGVKTGDVCKQTIKTKSHAGERKSAIPEFDSFIDEILPSDEPQVIDCAFSPSFLDYVLPNGVA